MTAFSNSHTSIYPTDRTQVRSSRTMRSSMYHDTRKLVRRVCSGGYWIVMAREKSCVKRSTEGSCSADGSSAFGTEEALAKRELTSIFRIGGSGGGISCGSRALVFSLKRSASFQCVHTDRECCISVLYHSPQITIIQTLLNPLSHCVKGALYLPSNSS